MAFYSGITGGVALGTKTTKIAFIKGFELEISRDMAEILTMGKSWKYSKPGASSWSGTFDGCLSIEDPSQKALIKSIMNTTEIEKTLVFILNDTTTLSGTAYISNVKVTMTSEDIASVSFTFDGKNALTA